MENNAHRSWNQPWFESFEQFLKLDFLIIRVLAGSFDRCESLTPALSSLEIRVDLGLCLLLPRTKPTAVLSPFYLFHECFCYLKKRVDLGFYLPPAFRRKIEPIELTDIAFTNEPLSATPALKLFVELSCLNMASAHNSTKEDDKFVKMLRVHLSDGFCYNFFSRRDVDQFHVKLLWGYIAKDIIKG